MSVSISESEVLDAKDISEDKCKVFEMFINRVGQNKTLKKWDFVYLFKISDPVLYNHIPGGSQYKTI